MTDIEKKAREYAELQISGMDFDNEYERTCELDNYRCAFLAGAAYTLGNQWRDAEKEKPEYGEQVLIMSEGDECPAFGEWCGNYWEREDADVINRSNDEYYPFKVIAWMEIPDYKPKGE